MIISAFLVQSFLFFQDVAESVKVRTSSKYAQEIIPTNDLKQLTTSQNGIPVYLYTDLLIIINCPSRIPGSVSSVLSDKSHAIFVNDAFLKESPSFQAAAIAHEEGHIFLDHMNNTKLTIDEKDVEADIHSMQQGHDVISMLNTMKSYGYSVDNRIETIHRIFNSIGE
jgi:predicted metal-dependent peptidase